MADLRTLVERDMDRAGTPAYTFGDLARRRDRKRRAQRLTMMAVALMIAALGMVGLIRAWDPAAPPVPASESEGPVSEKIAFVGQGGIGVIDAGGGEVRWLPTGHASSPTWSPDGSRIAFSVSNSIWVINADGTGLRRLTPQKQDRDTLPAWSPDGTRIAFIRQVEVFVMNADGSDLRRLPYEPPEGRWLTEDRPNWSSDGSEVIVTSASQGAPDGLVYEFDAIDVETGRRRPVAGPVVVPDIVMSNQRWASLAPALSPDGTRVAFVGEGGLYVANADGSGQKMIADGARIGEDGEWVAGPLTWSPDGTRIAAIGMAAPEGQGTRVLGALFVSGLFVIDAEGTRLVRLTDDDLGQGYREYPAWWSPPSSAEGP